MVKGFDLYIYIYTHHVKLFLYRFLNINAVEISEMNCVIGSLVLLVQMGIHHDSASWKL